jgi:hypothetical protein
MPVGVLQPMGIGDIFDTTFRLYRRHFVAFLLIALVVYVPYSLVLSVLEAATQAAEDPFETPARRGGNPFLILVPVLLLVVIVLPLCQAALMIKISASYLGEDITAAESYRRAAGRLVRLYTATILQWLIVAVGFVLLIVPGIIFSFRLLLVAPVVVLESHGPATCVKRSWELMRGNTGKGLALVLLLSLLGGVFNAIVVFLATNVPWPHSMLRSVVVNVSQAVVLPIQVAPMILLYYDLRIRKEAFDLERLASELNVQARAA